MRLNVRRKFWIKARRWSKRQGGGARVREARSLREKRELARLQIFSRSKFTADRHQ